MTHDSLAVEARQAMQELFASWYDCEWTPRPITPRELVTHVASEFEIFVIGDRIDDTIHGFDIDGPGATWLWKMAREIIDG